MTLNLMLGPRTQGENGGGFSQPRGGAVFAVLGTLGMLVCCGLLFLLIAAGGLASLSVITGKDATLFAGAAIGVAALLVVVGIALRARSRNRTRRTKTSGDACCQ